MRALVLLSTVVVLSGCAASGTTSASTAAPETVRIVAAGGTTELGTVATVTPTVAAVPWPAADVWRALRAAYDSLGIPVARVDSTALVVGNPGLKVRRRLGTVPLTRYLDCGRSQGMPSADTYEVHMSVLSEAQPAATGGSTVATVVQAMARPVSLSGEYVRCSSTGVLESRIAEAVKAQMR